MLLYCHRDNNQTSVVIEPERCRRFPNTALTSRLLPKPFNLKKEYPVCVGQLCGLQLCDCHASESNRVVSVYPDHRARAGVMCLTEHLRRCRVGEERMIKRKRILIGVEVRDGFLTQAFIEHERVATSIPFQNIIWRTNQHIVSVATLQRLISSLRI